MREFQMGTVYLTGWKATAATLGFGLLTMFMPGVIVGLLIAWR